MLTFVVGECNVLVVAGVPFAGELQSGEPVFNGAFHVGQVLTGLEDRLQVSGRPHVHDEEPTVGLHESDDGVR